MPDGIQVRLWRTTVYDFDLGPLWKTELACQLRNMGTVLVHYPRNGGSGPERLLCKGTAPDDIREGI
jgi:hypothetical protein